MENSSKYNLQDKNNMGNIFKSGIYEDIDNGMFPTNYQFIFSHIKYIIYPDSFKSTCFLHRYSLS